MVKKDVLNVSVVQANLHWENTEANLAMFDDMLAAAPASDMFILPEMFTTGFSMKPEKFATETFERGLEWMKTTAAKTNAAIIGSIMAPDQGGYFNRLLFVKPDGTYSQYDKKHLFGLGSETEHYKAGEQLLLVDYLGWKICPLICYDLRFPVWSRNTHNYDVLIYVANWPQRRAHHWRTLLPARAVENQTYVLASNRVGTDGNNFEHSGDSMIIDFNGSIIQEAVNEPKILSHQLSKAELLNFRAALPFLADADKFRL